jgi:hypothetical protein
VSCTRPLLALTLAATLSLGLSGCRTEYIIDTAALRGAEQSIVRTQRSVAVPAERVTDGAQVYVRYEVLDLERARPLTPTRVVATAPERRGHRVAGPVLLGLGGALLGTAIGFIAWDLGTPCSGYGSCWRGLISGVIGAPVGASGLGILIGGGVLTYQGYHGSSEVKAPGPGLVYRDADPKTASR